MAGPWAGGRWGSGWGTLWVQCFLGSMRGLAVQEECPHYSEWPSQVGASKGEKKESSWAQPNFPGHGSTGPQPLSLSLGPRRPQEGD